MCVLVEAKVKIRRLPQLQGPTPCTFFGHSPPYVRRQDLPRLNFVGSMAGHLTGDSLSLSPEHWDSRRAATPLGFYVGSGDLTPVLNFFCYFLFFKYCLGY